MPVLPYRESPWEALARGLMAGAEGFFHSQDRTLARQAQKQALELQRLAEERASEEWELRRQALERANAQDALKLALLPTTPEGYLALQQPGGKEAYLAAGGKLPVLDPGYAPRPLMGSRAVMQDDRVIAPTYGLPQKPPGLETVEEFYGGPENLPADYKEIAKVPVFIAQRDYGFKPEGRSAVERRITAENQQGVLSLLNIAKVLGTSEGYQAAQTVGSEAFKGTGIDLAAVKQPAGAMKVWQFYGGRDKVPAEYSEFADMTADEARAAGWSGETGAAYEKRVGMDRIKKLIDLNTVLRMPLVKEAAEKDPGVKQVLVDMGAPVDDAGNIVWEIRMAKDYGYPGAPANVTFEDAEKFPEKVRLMWASPGGNSEPLTWADDPRYKLLVRPEAQNLEQQFDSNGNPQIPEWARLYGPNDPRNKVTEELISAHKQMRDAIAGSNAVEAKKARAYLKNLLATYSEKYPDMAAEWQAAFPTEGDFSAAAIDQGVRDINDAKISYAKSLRDGSMSVAEMRAALKLAIERKLIAKEPLTDGERKVYSGDLLDPFFSKALTMAMASLPVMRASMEAAQKGTPEAAAKFEKSLLNIANTVYQAEVKAIEQGAAAPVPTPVPSPGPGAGAGGGTPKPAPAPGAAPAPQGGEPANGTPPRPAAQPANPFAGTVPGPPKGTKDTRSEQQKRARTDAMWFYVNLVKEALSSGAKKAEVRAWVISDAKELRFSAAEKDMVRRQTGLDIP